MTPCHRVDERKDDIGNTCTNSQNRICVLLLTDLHVTSQENSRNSVINHSSRISAGKFSMMEGAREGASTCLTIAVSLGPLILPSLLLASNVIN